MGGAGEERAHDEVRHDQEGDRAGQRQDEGEARRPVLRRVRPGRAPRRDEARHLGRERQMLASTAKRPASKGWQPRAVLRVAIQSSPAGHACQVGSFDQPSAVGLGARRSARLRTERTTRRMETTAAARSMIYPVRVMERLHPCPT